MGCLRSFFAQIGCAVVLVLLLIVGYVFRDQLGAIYRGLRHQPPPADTEVYVRADSGARAGLDRKLDSLERGGAGDYMDFTAGQIAAAIEQQLGAGGRRRAVDSVRVAFVDPEVRVRASLDMSRVPHGALGPFAGAVDGRQPIIIGGEFSADSAGRLLLTVTSLTVGTFPFPRSTIGAVLRSLGIPDARGRTVPVPLDRRVGDARVRGQALRLYRYEEPRGAAGAAGAVGAAGAAGAAGARP